MTRTKLLFTAGFVTFSLMAYGAPSFAEDGHDHAKEGKKEHAHEEKGDGHDHGKEDHSGHDHEDNAKKKKHKPHKGHDEHEGKDHGKDSKEKGHKHGEKKGHDHGKLNEEKHEDSDEKENHADHSDENDGEHGHDEGGEDEHAGHGDSNFGEGKAIVAIENDGQRFKLSKESAAFLKISSTPIEQSADNGRIKIKKDRLVEYQDKVGIFIQSGDWFELKEGKIVEESNGTILLAVGGISSSDRLVINRHGILRAAHLQATGQGGKGHAH